MTALESGAVGVTVMLVVVFGSVVGVYIDDAFIKDGMVDTGAMQPIARMGYMQYSVVRPETVFALNRPEVAAVKMINAPPFFETWGASIRHVEETAGSSRITTAISSRATLT